MRRCHAAGNIYTEIWTAELPSLKEKGTSVDKRAKSFFQ